MKYEGPNQMPMSVPLEPKQVPSHGPRVPVFESPIEIRPRQAAVVAAGAFQLTTSALTWKVSSVGSSVTAGTNGPAIDLSGAGFDTPNVIADGVTKYIVLEASVAAGVVSSWTFLAVDTADNKEIGLDTATPPAQDKVRLRIGKVVTASGSATATQYVATAQILTDMFLNGVIVKGFESHPFQD